MRFLHTSRDERALPWYRWANVSWTRPANRDDVNIDVKTFIFLGRKPCGDQRPAVVFHYETQHLAPTVPAESFTVLGKVAMQTGPRHGRGFRSRLSRLEHPAVVINLVRVSYAPHMRAYVVCGFIRCGHMPRHMRTECILNKMIIYYIKN